MTAMAGWVVAQARPLDKGVLERMSATLKRYGPDAQQVVQREGAAMLRTLLRITPEDRWDQQPCLSADGQWLSVFVGRLDNREELAQALAVPAGQLIDMADGHLVALACQRWGEDACARLLGDWALACWHTVRRQLFLARDPIGNMPLFWTAVEDGVVFASLPKALFCVPGVARQVDEERLFDYLCLLPMKGERSFFAGVQRVLPGHVMSWSEGRAQSRSFFQFDPSHTLHLPRDQDYVAALDEALRAAVARRLRSTGPVASHLSSGFDSSTVTAVAAQLLAQQGRELIAYTAAPREGYDGPVPPGRHADEAVGARALAARHPNVRHVIVRPDGRSQLSGLQAAVERMDRAPLNPCNLVWSDQIEEACEREGAKVLLTGMMGNMSISHAGEQRLPQLWRAGQWRTWWRELSALKRQEPSRSWKSLMALSLGPYVPAPLWALLQRVRDRGMDLHDYSAVSQALFDKVDGAKRIRQAGWDLSYRPWADSRAMRLGVLSRLDNGEYYMGAMTRGLSLVDPLSDLALFKFCLSLPEHLFLRGGQTRWILQQLTQDLLPPEIRQARTRGLQAADWHEGLRQALPDWQQAVAEFAGHDGVSAALDLPTLMGSLEAMPDQGWQRQAVVSRYRLQLLRGSSVARFVQYVDERNG